MRPLPSGGSRWVVGVGLVRWVIHRLFQVVLAARRDGWLELQLGHGTFLTSQFTSFHFSLFSACLVPLFLGFLSKITYPCGSVWETFVHEFSISNSHTEWNLLSSRWKNVDEIWEQCADKLNSKLTHTWVPLNDRSVCSTLAKAILGKVQLYRRKVQLGKVPSSWTAGPRL